PFRFGLDRAKYWELQDAGLDRFDITSEMLKWYLADETHPSHPQYPAYLQRTRAASMRTAQRREAMHGADAEVLDDDSQMHQMVQQVVKAAKHAVVSEVIETIGSLVKVAQHRASGHATSQASPAGGESDNAASAKLQHANSELLEPIAGAQA